jgi:hypothetical protein
VWVFSVKHVSEDTDLKAAYPPADRAIVMFCIDQVKAFSDGDNYIRLRVSFVVFLQVLFETAQGIIETDPLFMECGGRYDSLASAFYNYFSDRNKRQIFHEVVTTKGNGYSTRIDKLLIYVNSATTIIDHLVGSINMGAQVLLNQKSLSTTQGAPQSSNRSSPLYDWKPAQDAFDAFAKQISSGVAQGLPSVLLSFDEVHLLSKQLDHGRSAYDDFCSVLSDLKGCSLFSLFLSTTSQLSALAPAPVVHPSERGRATEVSALKSLAPPFTELDFDTFISETKSIEEFKLRKDQVNEPERLLSYGRPLSVHTSYL